MEPFVIILSAMVIFISVLYLMTVKKLNLEKKRRLRLQTRENERRQAEAERNGGNGSSFDEEAAMNALKFMQSRLTLSQIGPHFIFNSLNAIHYLIEKDPAAAQSALDDFSLYLRENMDSMKSSVPIPFEQELEHVETYIKLEKLRYEDELEVVYEIEAKDFSVPSLSVQAMVENAAHHGLNSKEGGGTIRIVSLEGRDNWCVQVMDDGIGFDPESEPQDGRTHTGIKNVRALLATMCKGTLDIISNPGEGTCVMIRIPK